MKTIEETLYNHGVLITDYISSSAYNGTITAMESYAEQQAIDFLQWVEGNYTFDEYNNKREPLYVDLLDRFDENPQLFTIKQLYQKFKEEQK